MRRALPGKLILQLAPGLEVESVSAHRDVRLGAATPSTRLDGGSVDRVLRAHTPSFLATRAFCSRATLGVPGRGHERWDSTESDLGLSRTLRVEVDPDADVDALARDLRGLDRVNRASPELLVETRPVRVEPTKGRYTDPARERIRAAEALRMEPGDSSLIVGLVDSGVDVDHVELRDRLRPGVSSVGLSPSDDREDLAIARGRHGALQDVRDDEGHGTACAGILCANGFLIPPGLAGAARLLPIRALCGAVVEGRARLTAVGSLSDIDSGLKTAIDLGARIVNLSFGTPESDLDPEDPVPHLDVIRYAIARDCVLVAAAGNSSKVERFYPAALPGVIAVGAVDDEGRPATFTTRGDHVVLSAPGVFVESSGVGGYARYSGTSFAAPLVTAACALLVARAARSSSPLLPASVRDLLASSAAPFASDADTRGCGAGILDVAAALRAFDARAREAA